MGQANIETAIALASVALQGTERLVDVQLKNVRAAVDQGMRNARALSAAKNAQEMLALQSSSAQPHLEKALAYSRSVYEIAADTQTQMSKLVTARISDLSSEWLGAFGAALKAASPGPEGALTAFKSALSAANDAYGTMTRAVREVGNNAARSTQHTAKAAKKKAH
jgi:phasin family protein